MTTGQEDSDSAFSPAVIDHANSPRNAGSMDDADTYASVLGPCGDNMEVWLKIKDDHIKRATFWTDAVVLL